MSDASLAETNAEAAVAQAIHEAVDCLDSELHDEAILACEAALKHRPACADSRRPCATRR